MLQRHHTTKSTGTPNYEMVQRPQTTKVQGSKLRNGTETSNYKKYRVSRLRNDTETPNCKKYSDSKLRTGTETPNYKKYRHFKLRNETYRDTHQQNRTGMPKYNTVYYRDTTQHSLWIKGRDIFVSIFAQKQQLQVSSLEERRLWMSLHTASATLKVET
jgi:hypothetical protein